MTQTFNNKKIFISVIVVLIVLLFTLLFFTLKTNQSSNSEVSKFSAIYLKTGDIYFGKLSWFPRLKIQNPWLLQRAVDANNQPQVSVVPFTDAFWKPVNEIYLNKDEIVFWTKLRGDSPILPFLSGESSNSNPAQP